MLKSFCEVSGFLSGYHFHIATDKALFSSEKCCDLSYFSTKTYVVGTH